MPGQILNANEINNTVFQPILAFQFRYLIDGVASYMIKGVNGIGFTESEDIIYHINTYYKIAARRMYEDVTLSLYDPCSPSGAQMIEEWAKLRYERVTGRAGYADGYWKDTIMQVLGPTGDIIREWVVKKSFIKSVNYGEYSYEAEAHTSVTLVLGNSGIDISY